jgi:hypothetical protein
MGTVGRIKRTADVESHVIRQSLCIELVHRTFCRHGLPVKEESCKHEVHDSLQEHRSSGPLAVS